VGKALRVVATTTDAFGGVSTFSSASQVVANVDDAATGTLTTPEIAQEGGQLTASLVASDEDGGIVGTTYQWQQNIAGVWTNLTGKNTSTFSIASDQSDVGKALRVVATTTDAFGGVSTFSSASQVVANVNDAPTGGATIGGTAALGQSLTADTSKLSDADGWGGPGGLPGFSYLWLANGVSTGVTQASYLLGAADVGKTLTVQVSYTDAFGAHEMVTSAASAVVTAAISMQLTGTASADTLNGGAGNDTLTGLGGKDILNGWGGNDVLDGGAGIDKLDGGEGSDLYLINTSADHSAAEIADAGLAGVDEVRFTATKSDTLVLFAGDTGIERVVLGTGALAIANTTATTALNIDATAVKNGLTLIGNAGVNSLTGTAFNDTLDGGAGIDKLLGGAGNDTLIGGGGADALNGGTGSDVFVFKTVTDSNTTNTDKITGVDFGGVGAGLSADRFHFDTISILAVSNVDVNGTQFGSLNTYLNSSVMPVGQAVLMHVLNGVAMNRDFLFVDANGVAGYQAGSDYAIELVGMVNRAGFDLSDLLA